MTELRGRLPSSHRWRIGADQLAARLALDLDAAIKALLSFEDIERTFGQTDLMVFRQLVKRASVEILRTRGTDQDAFLAGGKRVVDLSDAVIAVWHGKPAKEKAALPTEFGYEIFLQSRLPL